MSLFAMDIGAFLAARQKTREAARQTAAFFLMCGIDLEAALQSGPEERRKILVRLDRMIERERLKGSRRHWSYDLNRHIALKQAADRLRDSEDIGKKRRHPEAPRPYRRRRRHPIGT